MAVHQPKYINRLWRNYPHKVLQAFALIAGKYGIVGDSRLGHSTIAAGRRIPQDLEIISEAVAKKTFYKNKVLIEAIEHSKKHNSNLHLVGLISNGGIHSHLNHLKALLELCHRQNFNRVYINGFTDGIDSGKNDALSFVEEINKKIFDLHLGQFSSLCGRQFAMDRVGNTAKTRRAWQVLIDAKGEKADSAMEAISSAYKRKENDFTLSPTLISETGKTITIEDNDSIIFFNFRADRSLQLIKMVLGLSGGLFWRPKKLNNLCVTTFTKYENNLPVKIAFKRDEIRGTLGEALSEHQEKQLRVAESEKAAHVTTFFNCEHEAFNGEQRKIFASRKTFDPVMRTPKIAQFLANIVSSSDIDFILANFANVDMMSHLGDMQAAGEAIQVVDKAVAKVVETNLRVGGATIISADHGNIEQMVKLKAEEDPENKHTLNPVPFILVLPDNKKNLFKSALTSSPYSLSKIMTAQESLADIAPTVLELMNIPKPKEMTGHSLLNRLE